MTQAQMEKWFNNQLINEMYPKSSKQFWNYYAEQFVDDHDNRWADLKTLDSMSKTPTVIKQAYDKAMASIDEWVEMMREITYYIQLADDQENPIFDKFHELINGKLELYAYE